MPDEDDYQYALAGNVDLVGCVLDGADFSGASLQGRDFRNSKARRAIFDGADLTRSDFRGSEKSHASFRRSILVDTKFDGSIFRVNFSESILRNASIRGLLSGCDFTNADLTSADFSGARFNEGCVFSGALSSKETNFDGAQVLRPYLREPIFQDYELIRGVLKRREDGAHQDEYSRAASDAARALDRAISLVEQARADFGEVAAQRGIGHNNPPDEFRIISLDVSQDIDFLKAESDAIKQGTSSRARLLVAAEILNKYAALGLRYVSSRADLLVTGFVTRAGETLGSKSAMIAVALYFSDGMTIAVKALSKLINMLPL